jgi:uncharacterized protein (TIGR04222 family)
MTAEQTALWERIAAFDIDGDAAPALPFAARLARENGWSRSFADRAVREYKRFVFLTKTAGRPMCPSEQVDQVWHLHLTYTRSYWQRFCGEVLQCPLHHDPTRGDEAEGRKHWAMYADTLSTYAETFGEPPPSDLWPPVEQRFGSDLEAARVNRNDYWLIRKPQVSKPVMAASLLVAVLFALGCANPFNEKGTDFLPYLFAAWGMTFIVGLIVRRIYKGPALNPDEPTPELGPYEAAYLSGGRARVLTTALVRLKDMGCVDIASDGHVIIRNVPRDADPTETAVFDQLAKQSGNTLNLRPLVKELKQIEDTRFARLREQGLLTTTGMRVLSSTLPWGLCVGMIGLVGLPRLILGLQNDRPSGYLIVSMIALFIVTSVAFGRPVRRTRKAEAALANLSNRHARLRTLRNEPESADAALAVALFGGAVLTGTAYGLMYDRVRKYDAAGSGGGCSTASGCGGAGGCGGGGGGDGGGSGGGCGGCGGGGCGGGGGD